MFKAKNIITIQHTESIHHTNGMIGSWTDWDLSEVGKLQAGNIAKNLSHELKGKKVSIYCSTLLRAKQTSEYLEKELHVQATFTDSLKERSLGRAIGQSVQWLRENIENEEVTVFDKCFSDGESRSDVWERLRPFFEEIMNNDDENIIIISHGDTLSIFNAMWLGFNVEMLNSFDLYGVSGGVSFMYQTKGRRIIKRLSDTSYMK